MHQDKSTQMPTQIFLTGATGYIGGSILSALLARSKGKYEIRAFCRDQDRARKLSQMGVTPILGDLDNWGVLSKSASDSDVVIHAAAIIVGTCCEWRLKWPVPNP